MEKQTMGIVFRDNDNLENTEFEMTLLSYDTTAVFVIHQLDDNKERVNALGSLHYPIDKYHAKQIVSLLKNHFNL